MELKDVRSSYFLEKHNQDKGDFWLYYIVRPISFYLTYVFLKLNISANQATYFSIFIGFIGCGFIVSGNYSFRIIGALLMNLWIILDCVDGNIARFKKTFSKYGEFIDALNGYLMNALLFISVGIGAFNCPEQSFKLICQSFIFNIFSINENILIILGAWSSITNILSRLIFQKFMNTFRTVKPTEIKPRSNVNSSNSVYHKMYFIIHNIVSFSGFLTPILFLATIFRLLNIFVIFYAIVNTGVLIATIAQIILKTCRMKR